MNRSKRNKPFWKPNKIFKRIMKQRRRSKDKQALRNEQEPERHKKTDIWDWN